MLPLNTLQTWEVLVNQSIVPIVIYLGIPGKKTLISHNRYEFMFNNMFYWLVMSDLLSLLSCMTKCEVTPGVFLVDTSVVERLVVVVDGCVVMTVVSGTSLLSASRQKFNKILITKLFTEMS